MEEARALSLLEALHKSGVHIYLDVYTCDIYDINDT
jgi:hypothetical protein